MFAPRWIRVSFLMTMTLLVGFGCASSRFKQRKENRDRVAMQTRMYCDFVSQDLFSDVEVQLGLEMAKRCDPAKPFSISSYHSTKDETGVMYCCHLEAAAKLGAEEAKDLSKPDPSAAKK